MELSKKLFTDIVICALVITQLYMCSGITEEATASEKKQVFRLLAVEERFGEDNFMKSGQYLIRSLLNYSNWNNETDDYLSYIHLLSRYTKNEVKNECTKYWRGNSTKENVQDEIVNFLGSASLGEIVIFYYNGHCGDSLLTLDETIYSSELNQWLKSGGLTEAYVCVIIDACYSGSWINDGAGSSFGQDKFTLCSSRKDQLSWAEGKTVSRAWFTGFETTNYRNDTFLPLGVIGGFVAAKDLDNDGWISFSEDFDFAKSSIEQYSFQENEYREELCLMNPVSYNGLPNEYDPPLVLIETHEDIMNFYATWEGKTYDVTTFSNSTVEDFDFNQPHSQISFNVTGSDETIGFCNVTIPNELLGGPYTVLMDDLPVIPDPIWTWNNTHSFIYFTYNHSVHRVQIIGATVIPEFPSSILLPLFMVLAIIVVALAKKIRSRLTVKTT